MRPNLTCANLHCRAAQVEYQKRKAAEPPKVVKKVEVKILHEENDWGIPLDGDSEATSATAAAPSPAPVNDLPEGLQYRFEQASPVTVCFVYPRLYFLHIS